MFAHELAKKLNFYSSIVSMKTSKTYIETRTAKMMLLGQLSERHCKVAMQM